MICDQAIELLPWYLNGTLESGELAAVRQHLETCESCRAALAETGQAWSVFSQETATQHLSAQDLVALAWSEPPAGIDPAVAEAHLASCAECAAELELARMSRRLEEEGNVAVFQLTRSKPTPDRAYRGWRTAAIAASLVGLIAVGGWLQSARQPHQQAAKSPTGSRPAAIQPPAPTRQGEAEGELATLRQKVRELSDYTEGLQGQVRKAQEQVAQRTAQPDLTAAPWLSEYVSPTDVVRGEANNLESVTVPASASLAVLPLRAVRPEDGTHKKHEIVILSENGSPQKTKPIQRDPNGAYLLVLAHGELKPGNYTLQVYGTADGKRDPEPDGTYKIRIQ